MAQKIVLAANGTDRLVVSTICTHFIFFHEAGFQFRTERRHGRRWRPTDEALQPSDVCCHFNRDDDPVRFGATPQTGDREKGDRNHCIPVGTSNRIMRVTDGYVQRVIFNMTSGNRNCRLVTS